MMASFLNVAPTGFIDELAPPLEAANIANASLPFLVASCFGLCRSGAKPRDRLHSFKKSTAPKDKEVFAFV